MTACVKKRYFKFRYKNQPYTNAYTYIDLSWKAIRLISLLHTNARLLHIIRSTHGKKRNFS